MAQALPIEPSKTGHPKGLYVLFTTEMWERFNFYGMRTLLALFLVNALGFTDDEAFIYYGGFLGLSYLTPMLGGFIADRFLGNRNCILIGGTAMALGQLALFLSGNLYETSVPTATYAMWAGLVFIILGNGLFKPNISSMVGQIYPKADSRLDSAFTIFYMGINLGALLGQTICPFLGDVEVEGVRNVTSFKWGFLAAGVAMLLGTITFYILKNRYVVAQDGSPVGAKPKFDNLVREEGAESEKAEFSQRSILGAIAGFIVLLIGLKFLAGQNWVYSFIYSSGLTLAGLIMSDSTLNKVERHRIIVMYFVAVFVMFFWACFEQAGSSLTFIADKQTDLRVLGYALPASLIQAANGLFIIIFAIPFSLLWLWMGRKKIEPISTAKQGIGLLLLAFGFFIIGWQTKDLGTAGKLGVIWLFVMYLFHTLGELCLSPIGLSLVSKLAPKRFSSLLMGVWFLANAAGYALGGTLATLLPPTGDKYIEAEANGIDLAGVLNGTVVDTAAVAKLTELKIQTAYPEIIGFQITNLYEFFMVFVILPASAGVILLGLSGWLKKMMHGVK